MILKDRGCTPATRRDDDEDTGVCSALALCGVVFMFLPIPDEYHPGLIADLEGDPLVEHALSSATCGYTVLMACS